MQIYMCQYHFKISREILKYKPLPISVSIKNILQICHLKHATEECTGYREGIGFARGLVSGRRFGACFAGTIDVGAVNVFFSAGRNDSWNKRMVFMLSCKTTIMNKFQPQKHKNVTTVTDFHHIHHYTQQGIDRNRTEGHTKFWKVLFHTS